MGMKDRHTPAPAPQATVSAPEITTVSTAAASANPSNN